MTTIHDVTERWIGQVIHGRNAKGRQRPDDEYWFRDNVLFRNTLAVARLELARDGNWWIVRVPQFYVHAYLNGRPDNGQDWTKGLVPTFEVEDIAVAPACYEAGYMWRGETFHQHVLLMVEYKARRVVEMFKTLGIRALVEEDGTDSERAKDLIKWATNIAVEHERFRQEFAPQLPMMFDVVHDVRMLHEKRRIRFLDPKLAASRFRAKARRIAIKAMGLQRAS